jgi:general secretion pathway protein K
VKKNSIEKGMVLMTVLWIVLIISFISFALAAAVRTELQAAANSFDSERALFMAKGAAEAVFYRLQLDNPKSLPDSPIKRNGDDYVVTLESGEARVKTETDGARIDLNGADEKVLASLFSALGVDSSLRDSVVDSILDWRDPDDVRRPNGAEVGDYGGAISSGLKRLPYNAPFGGMQELLLVKNMTPEIYFARAVFDAGTNQHRKVAGLQDLATVGSGRLAVDVNSASADVLAALPGISRDVASHIVSERQQKPFKDKNDIAGRLSELKDTQASMYLTAEPGYPNLLISTATVQPSGTSKTVKLHIRADRQKKVLTYIPYPMVKDTVTLKLGGWEY